MEAPVRAFSSSWIRKFHLIQSYSSHLTAPMLVGNETEDSNILSITDLDLNSSSIIGMGLNDSTLVEDVTTVRDVPENRFLIKKLDSLLKTVDQVQRQMECCGLEGSEEWLNLYSGPFIHKQKTRKDLWWSDSWLPMRFTRSCCPHSNILCSFYQPKNEKVQKYYKKWIIGCRKTAVREITKGLRILCAFLIACILLQLILSPIIYFLMEQKRRIERAVFIYRWKRQLEVVLQQQRKESKKLM